MQRTVHETWSASSGTLTIVLTPSGTGDPSASLTLANAVFRLGDEERTVANASFQDITVLTAWGG